MRFFQTPLRTAVLASITSTAHITIVSADSSASAQPSNACAWLPSWLKPHWCTLADDPFDWPELRKGLREREKREQRLRKYMSHAHAQLQQLYTEFEQQKHQPGAGEAFRKKLATAERNVANETARIMYGVDSADERNRFLETYGCTAWTDEAIDDIVQRSPIVQYAAGAGQWAREAARRGADVVALDDGSGPALEGQRPVYPVGSAQSDPLSRYRYRTLLLVYPQHGTAERALALHAGETVIYVGEGRKGANASNAFFDALREAYVVEKILPVQPFSGGYERMFVLRRREDTPEQAALLGKSAA